jgi:outer membrane murein-binding lipoprotein Lpp
MQIEPMDFFKSQKVTELEARINELEQENATLRGDLEAAKKDFDVDQSLALVTANEEITKLKEANAEIPVLEQNVKALEEQVTTLEAKTSPEAINLLVIDAVASAGHTPIESDGDATGNSSESTSNLTGFAKVAAAFAKKQSPTN